MYEEWVEIWGLVCPGGCPEDSPRKIHRGRFIAENSLSGKLIGGRLTAKILPRQIDRGS